MPSHIRTAVIVALITLGAITSAYAQVPTHTPVLFPQVFLGTPGQPNDMQAYLSVTAGPHGAAVNIYAKTESEPFASPGVDRSQLWYFHTDQLAPHERKSYHINHLFWFVYGKQIQAGGTVRLICDFTCTAAIGQHHAAGANITDAAERARIHWNGAFVLNGERAQP